MLKQFVIVLAASSALVAAALLAMSADSSSALELGAKRAAPSAVDEKSETDPAAALEHGRYLVTAMGCNDCHTPFELGPDGPEPDMTRMLSGHPEGFVVPPAPKLDAPWIAAVAATNTAWSGPWGVSFTANLTPDAATGLGQWTEKDFVGALRSGRHMGRGREILPPMPWKFFGQLNDDDLHAIFAYLRTIPAIKNQVPNPIPPAAPKTAEIR